jgi:steroid delta-isomerase-like uncharacterized protein
MTMPDKSNQELIRELYDAQNRGDMNAVDRLGGDASFENVAFGETLTLREDAETLHEAFPDLTIEVLSMIEQGDLVMVEGRARGTHQGTLKTPIGDLPASHRVLELRFVDVYECGDGRIKSGRYYLDRLAMIEQLGLGGQAGAEAAPAPH